MNNPLQEFKDRLKSSEGFVYIWTNNINGKRYIGSRKGTPDDGYIGSGFAFKAAVNKYGIENFTRRIVYRGKGYRKMETMFIINANDALNSKEFYNLMHLTDGYCEHSEESKAKISASQLGERNPMFGKTGKNSPLFGKKYSEESIAKRSGENHPMFGKTGENHPAFGRKHSDETRAKMSDAKTGENHPMFGKKGLVFWNNGTISKRSKTSPGPDFVRGRLKKSLNKS